MSETNVVGWFEIYVNDMDRAIKFYKTVLNCGDFTDFSFGGEKIMGFPWVENGHYASGALVKSDGYSPGKGGTTVYFNSPDCGEEESRVVAAGGKILRPKHAIGEHGFVAILEDSEGNAIGVHSRK